MNKIYISLILLLVFGLSTINLDAQRYQRLPSPALHDVKEKTLHENDALEIPVANQDVPFASLPEVNSRANKETIVGFTQYDLQVQCS